MYVSACCYCTVLINSLFSLLFHEGPDPCDPSPCGPGAVCTTNPIGNAICRCEPGLIPKPDTITGCGPECIIDPDCSPDYICKNQTCIKRPDPCDPSPCGPGAICTVGPSVNPVCRCEPGLIPKPDTITGCGPECVIDPDCSSDHICENQKCVEKPDTCNVGARRLGDTFCDDDANNEACNFDQGNLLKSIDKKTIRRESIEFLLMFSSQ